MEDKRQIFNANDVRRGILAVESAEMNRISTRLIALSSDFMTICLLADDVVKIPFKMNFELAMQKLEQLAEDTKKQIA